MKLTNLRATFVRAVDAPGQAFEDVESIADAHGVEFLCPKCFAENGGEIGTHGVICWSRSRGTPDHFTPGPGRWSLNGTGLDDLTLDAESPGGARSVQLLSGCMWHGFVTNGNAE